MSSWSNHLKSSVPLVSLPSTSKIGRYAKCPKCEKAVEITDPDQQKVYGISGAKPEEAGSPVDVAEPEKTSTGLPPGVRVKKPVGTFESGGTKNKRRKKGDKLTGARIGIHLIFVQLIGVILMVALLLSEGAGRKNRINAEALSYGILGLYFLGFTGKACCLSTPAETGGREVMIAAIVMEVLSFGLGFAAGFLKMPLLMTIGNFIGFAAGILFLWFLEELAGYLKRDDLADLANSCVGLASTAFGISLLLSLMLLLFPFTLVAILMFIPLVMVGIVLVRYIMLIFGLRAEL